MYLIVFVFFSAKKGPLSSCNNVGGDTNAPDCDRLHSQSHESILKLDGLLTN